METLVVCVEITIDTVRGMANYKVGEVVKQDIGGDRAIRYINLLDGGVVDMLDDDSKLILSFCGCRYTAIFGPVEMEVTL